VMVLVPLCGKANTADMPLIKNNLYIITVNLI